MADKSVGLIEPVVIEPSVQTNNNDCAIVCIKMLLGRSYPDVLNAAKRYNPFVNGLTIRQMQETAIRLGAKFRYRSKPPDDDEIGIIDLGPANGKGDNHVAIYFNGCVLDPASGWIYTDVAVFLLAKGWVIGGFLWREK